MSDTPEPAAPTPQTDSAPQTPHTGPTTAPAPADSAAQPDRTGRPEAPSSDDPNAAAGSHRLSAAEVAALEPSEFAFPGPLRDTLVAAILNGTKTSTTSLELEYLRADEALPRVGSRQRLLDSAGDSVAVLEITAVTIVPLGDVDSAHARDEGEGFDTVAEWRIGHDGYWHGADFRAYLGDPAFTVTDDTRAVLERFRVVQLR